MANPRDLAEQAFALLQNALRESEARASELDEQLKRKKGPKPKAEEQLDVLAHRLENVEAERARWEQEAGHLEERIETERAKVAALKKKLLIAESGPEKLTKKEINFWRAKAEEIDAETREYKNRLAALRSELIERDALIERLQNQAPATPEHSEADAELARAMAEQAEALQLANDDAAALRTQLEERDRRLEELEVEVRNRQSENDTHAAAAAALNREIELLRAQEASLLDVLHEAQTMRATLQTEIQQVRTDLTEAQRALGEAQATSERTQVTVREREHRLVEVSGETEHLRTEVTRNQQRERELREAANQLTERLNALAHDLDAALRQGEQHRQETEAARAERDEIQAALQTARSAADRLTAELDTLRTDAARAAQRERDNLVASDQLQETVAARDREIAERDRLLAERQRDAADREEQLALQQREREERERVITAQQQQIDQHAREIGERGQLITERNERLTALTEQLAEQERALAARNEHVAERDRQMAERGERLAQLERELAERSEQLAQLQPQLAERSEQLADRDRQVASLTSELEQVRTVIQAGEREIASLRDTLVGANRDLDQLRHHKGRLEAELSDVLTRLDGVEAQKREFGEQVAGLEAELKDEKEATENLSEIANERREHITKLTEQVEEANERYEEAKWRLGKAAHFERLVKRRKGLVKSLLNALRAKMKANVALKAGLDGLRVYKAAAEANQQKLLARIDSLKADLEEADEAIARHHGATLAKEQLAAGEGRIKELEERLNTQAELIQSLESDLKAAKVMHKSGDEKVAEIARLQHELAAKDGDLATKQQLLTQLENDVDEQQRRLAKLRGSESETVRLKAISEKDRSVIDTLEREVAQLREALARRDAQGGGQASLPASADIEAKLKDRDGAVAHLTSAVKEHEATIKKLNESVESWKRKYNFLAADAPDAYKTAAEK